MTPPEVPHPDLDTLEGELMHAIAKTPPTSARSRRCASPPLAARAASPS